MFVVFCILLGVVDFVLSLSFIWERVFNYVQSVSVYDFNYKLIT